MLEVSQEVCHEDPRGAGRRGRAPGTERGGLRRRAWWSVLGLVPSLAVAFLVGEGIAAALGHPPGGTETAEWWVLLAAGGPALLVFVLPAVLAVHFGRQAARLGDPHGRTPAVVAVVVAGTFVVLNLVSAIGVLASG